MKRTPGEMSKRGKIMGFFKSTPKQKMQSNVNYNVRKARVAKPMREAFPTPKPVRGKAPKKK